MLHKEEHIFRSFACLKAVFGAFKFGFNGIDRLSKENPFALKQEPAINLASSTLKSYILETETTPAFASPFTTPAVTLIARWSESLKGIEDGKNSSPPQCNALTNCFVLALLVGDRMLLS